jgi:hypothetical protein
MANDDDDKTARSALIDDLAAVFTKHNVVGVVSFVRIHNMRPTSNGLCFDMEGGAAVLDGADDGCFAKALEYVADQQEEVAEVLEESRVEIANYAKWRKGAN